MFDGVTDSRVDTFCHGHINSDRDVIISPSICNKSEKKKQKTQHSAAQTRPSSDNTSLSHIGLQLETPPQTFHPSGWTLNPLTSSPDDRGSMHL